MKKQYLIILLIAGFSLSHCTESINDIPLEFNGIEKVYSDSVYVRQFVNNIYTLIPAGYNRLDGAMLGSATDEAIHSSNSSPTDNIAKGAWGPVNNPDDAWRRNYEGIRKANNYLNVVLPGIPDKVFRSQNTINVLTGQAIFLRAYFHFELIKRYGGIPLVTELFEANSIVDIPRNTYEECVKFIVDECDKAASLLPVIYPNDNKADLGRVTKGAALALKARMLLYAASPLFNNQAEPNDSYTHGIYNAAKWELAAEASRAIIALNTYALHPKYDEFYTVLTSNKEIILSRITSPSNTVEKDNGPSGYTGGGGGTGPSLNLVDSYEMANGTPFNWNDPAMAANPFANRDPRFYKSILYNGIKWMGDTIDTYIGGNDLGSVNSTKTSFYLRKFLSENAKWFGVTGTTYHCFPLFRYAEVLLNYAEAMNEAYGPEADPKGYGLNAKQAVELIRQRAGIVPFSLPAGSTKDAMRSKIQNERKIELAFEEHRHLDVRRWKIAEQILGAPVYGLRIEKKSDGTFSYQRVKVEDRVFSTKMYLYPIPQSEIDWNASLKQNPGW